MSGLFFGVRVLLESTRDNGDGLWPVDRVADSGDGVGDREVADESGQEESDPEQEGDYGRAESSSCFSGAREAIHEHADAEQAGERNEEGGSGSDQFPDEPVCAKISPLPAHLVDVDEGENQGHREGDARLLASAWGALLRVGGHDLLRGCSGGGRGLD